MSKIRIVTYSDTRRIDHNGKILATHKEKGRITASTINAFLRILSFIG